MNDIGLKPANTTDQACDHCKSPPEFPQPRGRTVDIDASLEKPAFQLTATFENMKMNLDASGAQFREDLKQVALRSPRCHSRPHEQNTRHALRATTTQKGGSSEKTG